jgi:two-component system, LytTR family, sensor kinase
MSTPSPGPRTPAATGNGAPTRQPPPLTALTDWREAAELNGVTAEFRAVMRPSPLASRLRWWGIVFAVWSLYGVALAQQSMLAMALSGEREQRSFVAILPWALSSVWLWAVLTPGIVWLARRFRIDRRRWPQRLLLHVGIALTIALVDAAWDMWLRPYLTPYPGVPVLMAFLNQLQYNLFQYFVIVAVTHSLDYYRLYRERRLQTAQLETELARAQLEVLKMQLQPHFLFNTLHTIAELVHEDPDAADRTLTRLGDFLRLSLDHAGRQEVPLRQELEFLHTYLEIELTRFGDRLRVRTDVAADTLDALVPNLILQPLVENAIKHGVGSHARAGVIDVIARSRPGEGSGGDVLELEVRDNGGGLAAPANVLHEGVGLRNTRSRLRQLYGDAHMFLLRNRTVGGVIVTLTIPLRRGYASPVGGTTHPAEAAL